MVEAFKKKINGSLLLFNNNCDVRNSCLSKVIPNINFLLTPMHLGNKNNSHLINHEPSPTDPFSTFTLE